MGYHQITIQEWLEVKQQLQKEALNVANGFIRLGAVLRRIKEERLFEAGGYSSIAEFAAAEPQLGLTPSVVSRLIAINEKYSSADDHMRLRDDYAGLGMSKLSEMLTLPDSDHELIRPETKREAIRELKRFNDADQPAGDDQEEKVPVKIQEANTIREAFRKFWEQNDELRKDLYSSVAWKVRDAEEVAAIVNPSGNRTFRAPGAIIFFYEQELKYKLQGGKPATLSWDAFIRLTRDLCGDEWIEETEETWEEDTDEGTDSAPAGEEETEGAILTKMFGGGEEGPQDPTAEDRGRDESRGTEVEEEPEIDMNPPEEPEPVEKTEENCAGANTENADEINENQPNLSAGDSANFGEKLQEGFEAGLAAGRGIIVDEQGQPAPEPEEAQEGQEDIDLEAIKAEQEIQNAIIAKAAAKALRGMREDVSRTLKEIDHNMNLQKWKQARKEAERLPAMIKRIEDFVKG